MNITGGLMNRRVSNSLWMDRLDGAFSDGEEYEKVWGEGQIINSTRKPIRVDFNASKSWTKKQHLSCC